MPSELIFAEDAIVALIVSEGIAPWLQRIESEIHATLRASVHQWAAGEERAYGYCGPSQADHEVVARILCRPNYGGDRSSLAYTSSSGQRSRQRQATPDSFSAAASRLPARFPVWSFHTTPASTISQSLGCAFEVGGLAVVDIRGCLRFVLMG